MSRIDRPILWGPRVLRREALGHRRWACVVEAPFDMCGHAELIGQRVVLDGQVAEVRGTVSKLPAGMISAGELIELLVADVEA